MGLIGNIDKYVSNLQDTAMGYALRRYEDLYSAERIVDEYKELKREWTRCRENGDNKRIPQLISKIIACKYFLVVNCKWPVSVADSIDSDINWRQIRKNVTGSIEQAVDLAIDDEYEKIQQYSKQQLVELAPTLNHYLVIAAIAKLVHEYDVPFAEARRIMSGRILDDYYYAGSCSYMGDSSLSELSKGSFYNAKNIESNFNKTEEMYSNDKSENEGCYITTAVCGSFNKTDNCIELQMFRGFRDNFLVNCEGGYAMIQEYYRTAPKIVNEINCRDNAKEIYYWIWNKYLKDCFNFIKQGKNEDCKELYYSMVKELEKKFL